VFSRIESGGKALINKLSPHPPKDQDNKSASATPSGGEKSGATAKTNQNNNNNNNQQGKSAHSSSSDEDSARISGGSKPYGYANRGSSLWPKKGTPELFGDARQQTWFRKQLLADSDDESDEQVSLRGHNHVCMIRPENVNGCVCCACRWSTAF
jgi:hypothetical protein